MLNGEYSSDGKKTVLIVDDEESICEALAFDLEDAGYLTKVAYSGFDAIETLKIHQVDLVITDFRMHNGSGLDVLNFARERHNSEPVVMMISGDNDQKIRELYNLGLDGVFPKPYKSPDLLAAVRSKLKPLAERLLGDLNQSAELQELKLQSSDIWSQSSNTFRLGRGGFSSPATLRRLRSGLSFKFQVIGINNSQDSLNGVGTVKWITSIDGIDRIGLEFTELDKPSLELFRSFLSKMNPKAYIPT